VGPSGTRVNRPKDPQRNLVHGYNRV
jgi:hypothetical protein